MSVPQPKVEVVITTVLPSLNHITFYATPDAASDFAQFGQLKKRQDAGLLEARYSLDVNARYDFDEVVAYIKSKQ